jgi:hypothetical protein
LAFRGVVQGTVPWGTCHRVAGSGIRRRLSWALAAPPPRRPGPACAYRSACCSSPRDSAQQHRPRKDGDVHLWWDPRPAVGFLRRGHGRSTSG